MGKIGWLATLMAVWLGSAQAGDDAKADFAAFRDSFRAEAIAAGISPATYDREMATAEPMPIVTERNNNQPEFSRPIWEYLNGAVSDRRVSDGLNSMGARQEVLSRIEGKYGVDAPIIAAIWGLESSYGNILGDYDVISALSTLAYQGRRQAYGKSQLLGALTIIDNGYANRSQLKGSWAGAMGQTQFIPTTYLAYAVDEDADGRRNLWSDPDDVFASTANYLAKSGYEAGKPWGFEVTLPEGFDYAQAKLGTKKSVGNWMAAGVSAAHGDISDQTDLNAQTSIIVPAGASGPAFMVFGNYRAIMKYNNSTAYALGIGMLSDALAGNARELKNDWPTDDRPLSLDERKRLQQALTDRGFNPGPVDGIIGAGTQAALRAWQRAQGMPADGYASAKILERLLAG